MNLICRGLVFALATPLFAAPVTFSETIAPLIYEKCGSCHRPGEAAPLSLTNYQEVSRWGKLIATVTQKRYMPPWHAQPASVAYRDERRLSDAQIALIQEWVKQGMPEGDAKKTPAFPQYPKGWQLGEPDLIVKLPKAFKVPASGSDVYRNFVIPVGLAEDKWIRAIEFRPSAPKVVHHLIAYADPTGSARSFESDALAGFAGQANPRGTMTLSLWAGGTQPHFLPEGVARSFPKGSDLILQEHFHPTGKEETEQTTIGLYFAKSAPDRRIFGVQLPITFGLYAGVDIPAGEKNYSVSDSFTLPIDVEAFSVSAHAHYLGKSMKLTATLPSGEVKTLLWIKDWDFAWQDGYMFSDFVALPKGTRLDGLVTWDNSAENLRNPASPPVRVKWGEASNEEMGSVTLDMRARDASETAALATALAERAKRDSDAAYQRDPDLRERVIAIGENRSPSYRAAKKQ
jgi:hypothetical protein